MVSMKWWRAVSPKFHSVSKMLLMQHCHLWIFPSQDTWTYSMPVPAIGTIYDLMHRYERRFPEVSSFGKYASRERHYREMCRWSVRLLVDSETGKQHTMESYGIRAEKIRILPFVAPRYIFEKPAADNVIKDFALPSKYFFYPAQFWEHKNHKRLIRALSQLKDRYPDINFVFVGSRKNGFRSTNSLIKLLNVQDRISVLGYVPDAAMPQLYQRARALIMPTFFGPTNIPPLEAMALGCPVAVSDIYGMRQQLGEAALYFDPESVDDIRDAMEQLWQDDAICADLAAKGRSRSAEWNQMMFNVRFKAIVDEVLADQKTETSSLH
jgi:glycosyltransferase involved in cell wall biosynthesis